MRVLVVEDERVLREGLLDLLRAAGHEVEGVADGPTALQKALGGSWDLVLLDLMLPGMDGVEVCRHVRAEQPALPILMLTARGSEDDRVEGLRAGADDYVTKPFSPRELLARVEGFARRARLQPAEPDVVEADGCRLDLGRQTAERDGVAVQLTPRETAILRWLWRHRVRAVSRAELLEHVWGVRADMQTRTVDMAVAKLRQKVERDPAEPRVVVTVTGTGYAWGGEE